MNRYDYRQAVAKALAEEMLRDPRVTIKGEDVLEEVENEDIVEATSLGREVADAFMTNPGLNVLVLAVLISPSLRRVF